MTSLPFRLNRRWTAVIVATFVVAGGVGIAVATSAASDTGSAGSVAPARANEPATPPPDGAAGGYQDPVAAAGAAALPADVSVSRVEIPSIGVSTTDLEGLSLDNTGELGAPVDYTKAGWYEAGVVPGQVGPAIIAGHVDSAIGPAIFEDLAEVPMGAEIRVTLSTGEVLTFRVDSELQSDKATFPTSDVYGNVPTPQLRVITCAGPFDRGTGHYTENLILFASLVTT